MDTAPSTPPGGAPAVAPFDDPLQVGADCAALEHMRARLREVLAEPGAGEQAPAYLPEPGGRGHRVIVLAREGLCGGEPLAVVGFFGRRRDADLAAVMEQLDAELVAELRAHPDVLSYSSLELPCGNWGNLVLLRNPDVAYRWRESDRHAYAARVVAPRYYESIRIHRGALPGGLGGQALVVAQTKYYDYRADRGRAAEVNP